MFAVPAPRPRPRSPRRGRSRRRVPAARGTPSSARPWPAQPGRAPQQPQGRPGGEEGNHVGPRAPGRAAYRRLEALPALRGRRLPPGSGAAGQRKGVLLGAEGDPQNAPPFRLVHPQSGGQAWHCLRVSLSLSLSLHLVGTPVGDSFVSRRK